jgi:arylsulfatase A-like enzyme
MKRRRRLTTVWAAIFTGLSLTFESSGQTSSAASKKPNIVFILVDNLGYGELGVYGGGILRGAPTPRIDKLASEGTRLLNFNVEAQCTPTRSGLMTGRFSVRSGTYAVPVGGQADGLTLSEITDRAVAFIKRKASAGQPFFAYVSSSMVHMLTLPNPAFVGKTGNGDWADCLAEMDYRTGQILDAIKDTGVQDNTIVIFASDNGPEGTDPWEGDSGPWRGTYFTATEASLCAPFIIRWPGKIPSGRVSNEIVHVVDMYPTLPLVAGAEVPKDRAIDGVDQLDFFLGKQENSNREGFPAYVTNKLYAVKWRNWKMHLIWQVNMYDPPQTLEEPGIFSLLTDLKEERDVGAKVSWVAVPMMKIVTVWEESLEKYPPIKMGTPILMCRRSKRLAYRLSRALYLHPSFFPIAMPLCLHNFLRI